MPRFIVFALCYQNNRVRSVTVSAHDAEEAELLASRMLCGKYWTVTHASEV